MSRRGAVAVAAVAAAAVLLAFVVTEAAMASTSGSTSTLYAVFGITSVGAGAVAWLLARIHGRLPSLRWTIVLVPVAAVVVVAIVVAASTSAMFLASAELRVVLGALLLGGVLGIIVAMSVTGPLTADLRALEAAAREVADGDLTVRTGVDRGDEVGGLAASLDRMVELLARARDQRERGESARRRLLTAVGHDLRTPLSSLQAAIESLQDGVAPDPERYLRSMRSDVALLRRMVDDLFVLAQLEAGELPVRRLPIDLSELVDGAVEAVAALGGQRGVSVATSGTVSVHADVDPYAIDRVLRNLLDNAIRHAPPGSTVWVLVSREDGAATVRVRDQGPGFPDAFVPHAFDRFSRADAARDRAGGGAGLGLAIAKQLIEAHAGRIWIEPPPGATVAFALPVADAPPVRSAATPAARA